MPNLRTLVQRMKGKPFTLIGVNSYDAKEDFRKGAKKHGVTWPVIFQGNSTPVADLYRIQGYPTIFVIDADGIIVAKDLSAERLVSKVNELVSTLESKRQ